MKLVRGLDAGNPTPGGSVVTVGNFDGVHLGHRALLERLAAVGRELELPSVVVTFEPLPVEYFARDGAPPRLSTLAEKCDALRDAGVDWVRVLRFDARLAGLEPREFTERVLARGHAARHVLVGDDFRFGSGRRGDLGSLREFGAELGFQAEGIHTVRRPDGHRFSSTAVREALAAGALDQARELLGRPYAMCGRVIRGDTLGRELGYPTANLAIRRCPALGGVFAVTVEGAGPGAKPGVASLGTRPTVAGDRRLLEVHLFDFRGQLYGRRLRVTFVAKLRDEHHFDSLEALTEQMRQDEKQAREIL